MSESEGREDRERDEEIDRKKQSKMRRRYFVHGVLTKNREVLFKKKKKKRREEDKKMGRELGKRKEGRERPQKVLKLGIIHRCHPVHVRNYEGRTLPASVPHAAVDCFEQSDRKIRPSLLRVTVGSIF